MTEALLERLRAYWKESPAWTWFGITIESAEQGACIARMPVKPEMINQDDKTLHGGVIAALIDSTIGAAVGTVYDVGTEIKGHTTVELNVSYLEGIRSPEVRAEARILRRGRTLVVGEANVIDTADRLCATGRAVYMVFR